MMNPLRFVRSLVVQVGLVFFGAVLVSPHADAADGGKIPQPLQPWQGWALWGKEAVDCPASYVDGKSPICFWPSRLNLVVEPTVGRFSMEVAVFAETWVPLPGGSDLWPLEVKVNGQPVPVVARGDRPAIRLPVGNARLEGIFRWSEIPQSVAVPPEIGLLALTLNGQPVESPAWDAQGAVWLKREATTEETDKNFLAVKVYAMLEDGIPLWWRSEVELIVSGKSREEDIGSVLPQGWKLAEVSSPIPVAVDEDGRMKAQVRAGKWKIQLAAFRLDNPTAFRFAEAAKPAVDEELVAFQAKPDFRMVDIMGAPSIDVSQTVFPAQWASLPVYRWDTATEFRIEERMRGMGAKKPENLRITRQWWLDESGRGLTFRDEIGGKMQQIWRLDAAGGQDLGSVRNAGQGQLITRNPQTGAPGVEIRTRDIQLEATGRVNELKKLSATGWQADADDLRVTLNLPPGWRLFALFGADWVKGDWLTAWTLLDIFLLLVFTFAVFRIWGMIPAVLAFLAFGLSYHEAGAPRYLWLALLVPLALLRVVPAGGVQHALGVLKWLVIFALVLVLVPFLTGQVQQALYPQMEGLNYEISQQDISYELPVSDRSMENTDGLVTKEYKVPPNFLPQSSNVDAVSAGIGSSISARSGAQEYLEAQGVTFPPGSSAYFLAGSGKIIVRNTTDGLGLIDSLVEPLGALPDQSQNNLAYDTKARIQTGPGVPDWTWRSVSFGWNGPVAATQEVHPILIPIWLERGISVVRVVLLLSLAAILLSAHRWRAVLFGKATRVAALALVLLASGGSSALAQFPDQEMLNTLRDRLLEKSDAFPNASDMPSVTLTLQGRKLIMEAEIHAAARCAVPLPGRLPTWSPIAVQVDGKPEAALRRDEGYLWLVLPEGVHRVRVEGLLSDATEWEWTFLLKPHRVVINAPDWTFSGVKPDGVPEQQVFFALKQKATSGQASYERQDYQTVAVVDRHIELGLVWQVRTTVTRLSPAGKAVSLRIPLLPGENVLTGSVVPQDGFVEVRLGAHEPSFSWESELSVTNDLKLATKPSDSWVERWRLVASPVWNVGMSGLVPIFEPADPDLVPVWHPWPGEGVDLTMSRPEAIAGATVTVNKAHQEISLGQRQRVSKLDLSLRCSLGEDFLVELPSAAEVTSLKHNDQDIPVRKDGGKLVVPLRPGEQIISIGWKEDMPLGFEAKVGAVKLPVESANITTEINVPDNRWVLGTYGPLRGPAVQFWSVLVCALLAALILGRLGFSPLRVTAWMLLVIGLTQIPLPFALVVVGWLFLLEARGSETYQRLAPVLYNLSQLVIVGVTVIALCILIAVVGEGLLGNPEMFIRGNGSGRSLLRWYEARSSGTLPQPGCFSVSIWWYRLLMLAWALWLAASLIGWLRWGWTQLGQGGFIRRGNQTPPPLK